MDTIGICLDSLSYLSDDGYKTSAYCDDNDNPTTIIVGIKGEYEFDIDLVLSHFFELKSQLGIFEVYKVRIPYNETKNGVKVNDIMGFDSFLSMKGSLNFRNNEIKIILDKNESI
jgi:hypothetical protein